MDDIWMGVLETFSIITIISVFICALFQFIGRKLISQYGKSSLPCPETKNPPEYFYDLDKIVEIIGLITPVEQKGPSLYEGNYNGRKVLFEIFWVPKSLEEGEYTELGLRMQSNRTDFPPDKFFTLRHYQPTGGTIIYKEWVLNKTSLIPPPFHCRQEFFHDDRIKFLQKIQKFLDELSDACDAYEKASFNKRRPAI